jgi:uncharacterized protein (UPF0254 family)
MGHISFWSMLMMLIYWGVINTTEENREAVIDASKKAGLQLMQRKLSIRQNHNIKIASKLFENVTNFKYFGMKVTNKN